MDKVIIVATSPRAEEVAKTLATQYHQVKCIAAGDVVRTLGLGASGRRATEHIRKRGD